MICGKNQSFEVERMEQEIKILDKGFVRLVDVLGSDELIVNAARTSYKWNKKSTDGQLIDYLIRNEHNSPLEFGELVFHVKVPIFVARQMFRHRTASVSEISARYTVVEDEFYLPEYFRTQNPVNKQGSSGAIEDKNLVKEYEERVSSSYYYYNFLLQNNVAREMARIILPLSVYTQFYWKQDLRNLLHFIRLRADYHAQLEIQEVANAFSVFVREKFPLTYAAFEKNVLNSVKFTQEEISLLFDEAAITVLEEKVNNSSLKGSKLLEIKEKLKKLKYFKQRKKF